jgi:hypothetical protein
MTCPAHLRRLVLMCVTMSLSLYNVYNSLLYFILHFLFSFVGPKMAVKIFLSKTLKIVSSDFDKTQVSPVNAFVSVILKRTIIDKPPRIFGEVCNQEECLASHMCNYVSLKLTNQSACFDCLRTFQPVLIFKFGFC